MKVPPKTIVRFPNLFIGFLSEQPTINANYAATKAASEKTILRSRVLSARQVRGVIGCDFSYFASVMVPHADAELLRIICDWGNWIFPFDDMFDNGDVRDDPVYAQKVMRRLEKSFGDGDGDRKDQTLPVDKRSSKQLFELAQMHGGIYKAIAEQCSPGIGRRYVASMRQYSSGTLAQVWQAQVWQAQTAQAATFEEVLAQRRQSVCVTPLFVLVGFGHEIDLPDDAFENAHVRRLEMLGVEITLLHNDLLSYCKEEEEGVIHNTVAACRLQGMSAQEAVTFVGKEVSRRMVEFEEAVLKLEGSDHGRADELIRYVQGIRDVIKANLWWSFQTERFLSEQQKFRLLTEGTLEIASVMPCCHRLTAYPASAALVSLDSDEGVGMQLPLVMEVQARAA